VSGSGRPDRMGSGAIVALHSERRSKSEFISVVAIGEG